VEGLFFTQKKKRFGFLKRRKMKDPKSDLHAGLDQVVFAAKTKTRGQKRDVVWPQRDVDDSYIERMFASPSSEEEVLSLPALAPRPATESEQLLAWHRSLDALHEAPPLDMNEEARVGQVVPDMDKLGYVSPQEMINMLTDKMDSILLPTTYW
jgi:hypothetical protein